MKIYLAGPLFTLAEREFNARFAAALTQTRPNWVIVLPQDRAKALQGRADFHRAVFDQCLSDVEASNIVIAMLDGADVDSGTCIEMGYARAKGKCVIGVRTDFRSSEDRGVNLMVSSVCDTMVLVPSTCTSVEGLAAEVINVIESEGKAAE